MWPQAEQYLQPGRDRRAWWRYLLGLVVIAASWLGLGIPAYGLIASGAPVDPLVDYVAVNFSIFAMLVGLVAAMRLLHRRPLLALVAPDARIDWARVFQGAAAWTILFACALAVEVAMYPGRYELTFDPGRFLLFAPLALVLTPIQTTVEELVFRGYVMQGLATVVRRPPIIAIASAVIFAVPHLLNPEMQFGWALVAASYLAIGLLLAAVTLRDGRLELAIGVHAANNLLLVLVANYEGSVLPTEAILTAGGLDAAFSFFALIASAGAFYWWFFGRGRSAPGGLHG